ncbi:TonB-dependent receptor [Sphingosinicella sp. BN140058]|uniref:TonB-dependent receptor n=1 Tax=Sphingosinicella sp. BN140058 TaxID=1892855 RepID=UPI00101207FA|nr:TonB-dependent receptor [Sphingosinicella sp. BN140058]QAY77849.1 TonB-dependent receptor [Sphingosinicella sp. BN140058]
MTRTTLATRLLAGCALFGFAAAAAAQATDAAAGPDDGAGGAGEEAEIVITGSFAESLNDALRIKRRADSIADAVSAADIGDFPSVNVAEALQRLPGVSISREAGEGQFVSVRGLGPNFSNVTLNGAPIAYNENIRNSDQSGRQFQFRVIPADLISGIVVTKAPTADIIDGGIGGAVDIRIASPLDTASFVSARAFGHYEQRTEELTPNGSLSAGWRNDARTLGVIGGISYQTRKVQFERFQHFGYTDRVIAGQTVSVPNDVVTTLEREDRRRLSAMGGVEWAPIPALRLKAEALYSNFNNEIMEDRVSFEWGTRADFASKLVPGSAVIKDGVLYGGELRGGRINRNAEFSEQTHENLFLQASATYDASGWRIAPSFSYSRADSGLDLPLQRIDGRTADNQPGLVYSLVYGDDPVGNRRIGRVQTNLDLTQANAAPFYRYRIRPTNSLDDDKTALVDISRTFEADLGGFVLSKISVGGQYTDRSRDYQRRDRTVSLRPGASVDGSFVDQLVPSNVFNQMIDDFYGRWVSYDRDAFKDAFIVPGEYDGTDPQSDDLVANGQDLQQSYAIGEKIKAGYVRADFAADAIGLRGNAGLRYVTTSTEVDGTILRAGTGPNGAATTIIEPARFEGKYDEWLPSLNLNFDLTRNLVLRLAASRSLTRPSLADLRTATVPNSSVISDVYDRGQAAIDERPASALNGVGGNPDLKPYTALNFDASLEYYFDGFGGLSVALFHKDIKNFIGSIGRTEQVVLNTRTGQTVTADFLITRPQNIGDAKVSGIEIGAAVEIAYGFGIAGSATFTDSEAKIETPAGLIKAQLQGVSDTSFSISPFFKLGPVEANFSYTWRSDFSTNGNISPGSNAVTNPLDAIVQDGSGTLDMSAKVKINPALEIFVEGTNVLDERQAAYQGTEARPYQIHEYGRSFNFGVRASF